MKHLGFLQTFGLPSVIGVLLAMAALQPGLNDQTVSDETLATVFGGADYSNCTNASPCEVGCKPAYYCPFGAASCFLLANHAGSCASGTSTCSNSVQVLCYRQSWSASGCHGTCLDVSATTAFGCSPDLGGTPKCPGGGGGD